MSKTKTKKRRRWGSGSIWAEGSGYRARVRTTKDSQRFETRLAAEDWLRQQTSKLRRLGRNRFVGTGDEPDLTFGDTWDRYEKSTLKAKHPRTARDERIAWARVLRYVPEGRVHPLWKVLRIRDLRQGHVDDFRAARETQAAAPDTIRLEMSMLRKLANWAADHGYCDAPRARWKLPVGRSRKAAPVTETEYGKLLEQANPVQKAILTWYWETGCRPSELVAIRRADFDRKAKLVTIPTSKTGKRTGRPTRQFPLEKPELIRVIRERNAWLRAVRNRKESTPGFAKGDVRARLSSEWLFPGRSGAQIATGGYAEALWSCYKRAGISKIDIIGFRHAFATRFLQKGADPLTLAKLMGTSMSMIERTYGHLMMEHAREMLRRV